MTLKPDYCPVVVLVDSSVWVSFLQSGGEASLVKLLDLNEVLVHDMVLGDAKRFRAWPTRSKRTRRSSTSALRRRAIERTRALRPESADRS